MKTLLVLIATLNMASVDSHTLEYNPNPIQYNGLTYQIEEDYSISMEYIPYYIKVEGVYKKVNEDGSLSPSDRIEDTNPKTLDRI